MITTGTNPTKNTYSFTFTALVKAESKEEAKKKIRKLARKDYIDITDIKQ